MADPAAIETILQQGARKARAIATPKLAALREVLGLRAMTTAPAPAVRSKATPKQGKMPRFASFRDADGKFRFRLFSADGEELLLSKSVCRSEGGRCTAETDQDARCALPCCRSGRWA